MAAFLELLKRSVAEVEPRSGCGGKRGQNEKLCEQGERPEENEMIEKAEHSKRLRVQTFTIVVNMKISNRR